MRLVAILMSTLALGACNMGAHAQESEGSGRTVQRDFQLAGFDAIGSAGAQDVIVTVGGQHAVRAEGDAEVLERLELKVEGGTLKIGTKKDSSWSVGWGEDRPKTRIFVTMPAIRSAAVAGSGDMRINRAQGDRFEASIAGSGDIEVGQVQVSEAKFSVAGSGNIKAAGTAQRSSASVAGSGDIDTSGVQVRMASVSVAGSGDVRIHASETADVSIVGSGDVEVAGPARCTISKRGSGDVRCTA
ncbi:MAG TPA: head GIN domain-containing protein [Sphingomicrobium sp.]|nr:head GIN domain-containing protein [Sphingomicrobium sp.]